MGVFKWLRRERVTVTTNLINSGPSTPEEQIPPAHIGTIRTEEYKRDLAEFQARRSSFNREEETPVRKKCGRHSLPVSCTDCTGDPDTTFNYEKKSAIKYKKKNHKRARSAQSEEKIKDGVPNIQFLFQNQVFMPGNLFGPSSFSEPPRSKRNSKQSARRSPDIDFLIQKHIDFKDENQDDSPPLFYKNNSLPFDVKNFLDCTRSEDDEVDGLKAAGDVKSSQSSSDSPKGVQSEEKLWEVMSELKHFDRWADEQLQPPSGNTSKSDDNKSETSAYGLPIASSSNLNVTAEKQSWSHGKWGVVPVQIKKLRGVTIHHVKKKRNTEINILRKCRHPNIILLMGLFPDVQNNVHIICERCVDTLYNILHVQGRIVSAQTSVHYALDVANALVFLRMQGYVHTALTSSSVMVTAHDTVKLTDLSPCVKLPSKQKKIDKDYELYSPEPQYVNIEDTRESNEADCEPLLSERSSEAYLSANAVPKEYTLYSQSEHYHWQAPEMFEPDEEGMVFPCSRSDVYSLSLVLWECCNATLPWKSLSYEQLKEQYVLWKAGVELVRDGTYPGCLLALLQRGLAVPRARRPDLTTLQSSLHDVKGQLDEMEYIIIPARLSKKKSNFSSHGWETSPTDSECQSPKRNIEHEAVVHTTRDSSTESEKDCSKSDESPLYETIRKVNSSITLGVVEKCFVSADVAADVAADNNLLIKHDQLEEEYCSTPLAKLRARVKDMESPGMLHRSDSTEYCSILSPDPCTSRSGLNDNSSKDRTSVERPTAKLSRSFTPKSYKPLHIKVPEFNLDSVKTLLKDRNSNERSSYNFDIKNYSLPTTPIARSNKLRKNAWLSGELNVRDRSGEKLKDSCTMSTSEGNEDTKTATLLTSGTSKERDADSHSCKEFSTFPDDRSPESIDTMRDSFTGLRRVSPPQDFSSPETEAGPRECATTWSFKSSSMGAASKYKIEEDILANVNVKPLVAIHERWIYEANRKSGRSMSLPEDNRDNQGRSLKPASHCVDTLQSFQKSLPQLYKPRAGLGKTFRARPPSPANGKTGSSWGQYCQAREAVSKNMNFNGRDPDRCNTWRSGSEKGTSTTESSCKESKVDQSTDTMSIEEFIRDLIRKEFQHLLHEISDDASETPSMGRKNEELLNRGVANVLESLRTEPPEEPEQAARREPVKSFSRVKINGNNKPLLQITFSRSGENSLQVLDECVNVTICDTLQHSQHSQHSLDDTLTDDVQGNSLKRCQAFSAIQEARSTEDLYIDDELSAHVQENFGRVKLIPLHGSLHEILCERQADCCLLKVKQESGCDTVYFRCDGSEPDRDRERDAVDGAPRAPRASRDTVVFKRSISLVEERIQRLPRDRRPQSPAVRRRPRTRPKSEVLVRAIGEDSRTLSTSSPSLLARDRPEEVEVNIESAMCYQDSSSDECLKCRVENDDFELIERAIERDVAVGNGSLTCGCLEKISEENLSVLNEEALDKN